ncbi:MAG: glycosyltransferase family 2 protein [Candidatus Kerfeldbacteria bacterium]|nr:glycosyltransferase family 2 protein [Candidatus Kerfeldbacteria bacterium]
MNQPLVSILIVTYNAERYIAATLRSCLDQTYPATEILVWDNHSTDATRTIINQIGDSRVHLTAGPSNLGPYQALNELLAQARGELIAIQDHDDLWLPTKLEQQVRYLTDHLSVAACGTLTFYYYEERQTLISPPNPEQTAFVDHTSLVFRRSAARYDPRQPLPDEFFERDTLRRQGTIACLQTGLTIHRIRHDGQNLSSQRVRGNIRGAWSHFRLTGYRDVAGLLMFLGLAYVPAGIRWWLRRHLTLRRATWLTREQFTNTYQFTIT